MRTTVAAAVACLIAISLSHADDTHAAIKKETSIPAQGLGPALRDLANERDFQIVYVSEDVNGLRTSGATGQLTTQEALTKLLDGTGLAYRHLDDKTITVYAVSANAAPSQAAPQPLRTSPAAGPASSGAEKEGSKSFWKRLRLAQAESRDTTRSSEAGSTDDSSGRERLTVEEVIVTAQKRQERLQDVPISISVLGGEQLDKSSMEGVSDALDSIAGVATIEGINRMGSQVTVRGVGAQNALLFGASPIAYYLDSVPYGFARHSFAPDAGAYDLERVEVLRGPQGTLYGANALNGVVRILTHEPDLGEFDFKARTGLSTTRYGSENYRGDIAINVPAGDKFAARVVAGYQKFSGWIDKPNDDDANEGKLANVRLKLKAQPNDKLSLGFSAIASRQDYAANSVGLDDRVQTSAFDEPQAADYEVYAGTLTYDFGGAQLTSSTSYMDFRGESALDFLTFPAIVRSQFDNSVFAHESTLTSSSAGPWKWSAGIFYRDAKDRTYQPVTGYGAFQGFSQVLDWNDYSESYAVYGEITRELLDDRLELTGGVRYFKDEVRVDDRIAAADSDAEFDAVSPRVVLTWKPSQDAMVYASFAKGFRSGVLQVPPTAEAGVPPAEPDTLLNYEIGTKLSLFNDSVDLEAAVFYIDWKDIMTGGILVASRINPALQFGSVANTVGASGPGFEIAANYHPFEGMAIGANYGVNDLTFDADLMSGTRLIAPKGSRIAYSPKHTANVFTTYEFPVGQRGFRSSFAASVNYVSEIRGGSATALSDPQTLARASFSILAPQNWEATLFVDNLTNEQDRASPSSVPQWVGRPRPRTIGLQLQYDF